MDEGTLGAIREDRMLSPRQWRERMEKALEKGLRLGFMQLETLPTREFPEREREILDPDFDRERPAAIGGFWDWSVCCYWNPPR